MKLDLRTCSYSGFRPAHGVPVCISVSVPQRFRHIDRVSKLIPSGIFSARYPLPYDKYLEKYLARLDQYEAEILSDLRGLGEKHHGRPLVMLCYEDTRKGDWCHRDMAAGWLQKKGYEVREMQVAVEPPPSLF